MSISVPTNVCMCQCVRGQVKQGLLGKDWCCNAHKGTTLSTHRVCVCFSVFAGCESEFSAVHYRLLWMDGFGPLPTSPISHTHTHTAAHSAVFMLYLWKKTKSSCFCCCMWACMFVQLLVCVCILCSVSVACIVHACALQLLGFTPSSKSPHCLGGQTFQPPRPDVERARNENILKFFWEKKRQQNKVFFKFFLMCAFLFLSCFLALSLYWEARQLSESIPVEPSESSQLCEGTVKKAEKQRDWLF